MQTPPNRYLPKAEMFELLNRVYAENETVLNDHTNMAIVLFIMGIGYVNPRVIVVWLPKAKKIC
jgi:hypothetical protein